MVIRSGESEQESVVSRKVCKFKEGFHLPGVIQVADAVIEKLRSG